MVFDPGEGFPVDVEQQGDRAARGGKQHEPALELALELAMRGPIRFVRRAIGPAHEQFFPGKMSEYIALQEVDQLDDSFPPGSGGQFLSHHIQSGKKFAVLGVNLLMTRFKAWIPVTHRRGGMDCE